MLENRGLEIIILAVVVLLLFGAKRLPDSARALGKSLRILKSEVGAMKSDDKGADKAAAAPAETVVAAPKVIQTAPGESAAARPVADEQPEKQAQHSA
ncbi:Sec-independent protein translocase subunit TatA [Streptacidiphilus sp. EB129]|uniref:Sec-independent protein translocase subunit TatA n=1 Tax=Streptacidiphilus sp. EB129 TaxID=3156262 RepID=UPI00351752B9